MDIPFHCCAGFLSTKVYQCKYFWPIYVLHVFGLISELELVLFFLNVFVAFSVTLICFLICIFIKNTSLPFLDVKNQACNAIAAGHTNCRQQGSEVELCGRFEDICTQNIMQNICRKLFCNILYFESQFTVNI